MNIPKSEILDSFNDSEFILYKNLPEYALYCIGMVHGAEQQIEKCHTHYTAIIEKMKLDRESVKEVIKKYFEPPYYMAQFNQELEECADSILALQKEG